MATRIAIMPLDEVVQLVNEWGTLPRTFDGRPVASDNPALTTLADELHPVFAAARAAEPAPEQAAHLTALLAATRVRPVLAATGDGRLSPAWVVDDPAQTTRAAAALALREQLSAHPGRVGVCADRQCADVYVDLSPAGRRRFCCLTCQNRARAESFRKRRATPGVT